MKKTENQTRANAQRESGNFIIVYTVQFQKGREVSKKIDESFRANKRKYEVKLMGSSFIYIFEGITIKVYSSRYDNNSIQVTLRDYSTETRAILEEVIQVTKPYQVYNTNDRVYCNYTRKLEKEKPVELQNSKQSVRSKMSYEKEGNIFSMTISESCELNLLTEDKDKIIFTESLKVNMDIERGALVFIPNIIPMLIAKKDDMTKSMEGIMKI